MGGEEKLAADIKNNKSEIIVEGDLAEKVISVYDL